ncbi:uridine kinase [Cognaticolwellia beringensis]|uniref:Uridine kinase n=1 Tax=Cognaticolwellia beringensis TaxID=1967665 RepID=A0A222GCM4_9GAMM|nr:uridine kinase [Cognaticolwellia beringensis]ASP49541.1 uridine kinase [Cognaticolwellia beringensis]
MQTNKPTIIAVTGASASGKSLFAQTIYDELLPELGSSGIAIMKEDSYYKSQSHLSMEERIKTNYDHPSAFEHSLLSQHLTQLSVGESVDIPTYCYKTHTRLEETVHLTPTPIILIEGILLFADKELRDKFDIKIYIDTPLDICLVRRINRDTIERSRSIASITEQYLTTVRPMYHQHIQPNKPFADIVVTRGGKNRMAIEMLKAKIRQLMNSNL